MSRPIVLSNGELHVGLNNFGLVHDFYYPYVGSENHSSGASTRHRVGIWVDGTISWLDDEGDWTFKFRYPHKALIGHTIARNDALGILIEIDDFVDASVSAFMRNIHIINLRNEKRDVRLFTHQAFVIGDSRSYTDTAQYLPDSDAILHYRGRRAFIISGLYNNKPFDQHSIGLFGIEGREGTYRDADDGELSGCNGEHGRVDSTMRFKLDLDPLSSERVHYWIAAGTSTREALYIHKKIVTKGVSHFLHHTADHWKKWLEPALLISEKIDKAHQDSFMHSVMIIKAHIDKRGAVIASTDSSMLHYARDDYEYCWPRDGALVLWPLIRMGYTDEITRFFEFCCRGLHPSGYLMHKYRADGGLGASWHTYIHDDGNVAPPIQEDETAIVLFVFAQFYDMNHDQRLLTAFYESMVKPMATFLSEYIDETTNLPKPSYDLWEEVFLTTTYTTSVVHAALLAAADLAEDANDADSAVHWRAVANDISAAAKKHLFNDKRQAFYKGLISKKDGIHYDETVDASSIYGAFMFGLFGTKSDELAAAVNTYREIFKNTEGNIGYPRYENDTYHSVRQGASNPWIITTLWSAQMSLEEGDGDTANAILEWTRQMAGTTGALPEQINPHTNGPVSPRPLAWSQAEYVSTLLDTLARSEYDK